MSKVVTSFSNDESACPPTLLKTVSTTGILVDQFHKFHNSCFMETLKALILTTNYIYSTNIFYLFTVLSYLQDSLRYKQFGAPFTGSSSPLKVFLKFSKNQQKNIRASSFIKISGLELC